MTSTFCVSFTDCFLIHRTLGSIYSYTRASYFSPGSYGELSAFLRELRADLLPDVSIVLGDFNGHVFDDVARLTAFDHAFRAFDTDMRLDGFQRFPQVTADSVH